MEVVTATVELDGRTATILVVDDDPDVADLYAAWLGDDHDVSVAYDGAEAIEAFHVDVDLVFLDRQMPAMTGDEVLDRLDEQESDPRVVMVTAVDPDFDILSMPFDDYLTKPVTSADLEAAVDEMLRRDAYDDDIQEYFSLASKKATLEAEKDSVVLRQSEDYAEVSRHVEELAAQASDRAASIENPESLFAEFPGGD